MTLSLIDIVEYKYPGQIALGNVYFRKIEPDPEPAPAPEGEPAPEYVYFEPYLAIAYWNVPNEVQPTEADLLAYGALHERAIEIYSVATQSSPLIQRLLDTTAQSRQYYDAASCVSYVTSSNTTWQTESQAFIAWRDSVWDYAYNLYNTLSGNEDPIPSIDDVINGCPVITWPN